MTTEPKHQQQLLREKRESIIKRLIEAENRHDVNASIAAFHSPRYVELPTQMIHDGRQAVGQLLSGVFKAFPDFAIEIIKTYHSDDAIILEAKMKGTHVGE
jgi:predicted SnoaL-like aldol condensation-catalyzing enzyme